MEDLLDAWRRTVTAVGGAPADGRVPAAGRDLLARWGEPHRAYHTPAHLRVVLSLVDDHAAAADAPDRVRLAAWYHDAVYDPARPDNEEASAGLALAGLVRLGVAPAAAAAVARLVRLTATHDPGPGDRDGALLCDADLAVLGAPEPAYRAYAAAVRQEYRAVPEAAFRAGRARILRGLLARPRLYRTPDVRHRLEAAARLNLAAEVARLDAGAATTEAVDP